MKTEENSWGPIPGIAARRPAGRSRSPWLPNALRQGWPWACTAGPELWPPALPPGPCPRRPAAKGWRRLLRWFAGRFPAGPATVPEVDRPALLESQRWLVERNLRALSAWFAPFWQDLPIGAAAVSHRAVSRALMVHALAEDGPGAARPEILPPLEDSDPLGDHISFHLDIETLVATVGSRLGLDPRDGDRSPGGLRSRETCACIPALVDRDLSRGGASRSWLRTLDALVGRSPLTTLVYADLRPAEPGGSGETASPPGFASLLERGPVVHWWHDLWISLLMRSLVGAVSSPARLHEHRAARKREFERSVAEAQARSARHNRPFRIEDHPALQRMKRGLDELRTRCRSERLGQLVTLTRVFRPEPLPDAAIYAQLRFLDMLVRNVATRDMERLGKRWLATGGDLISRKRSAVLGRNGVLMQSFYERLLGAPLPEIAGMIHGDEKLRGRVVERIEAILAPPFDFTDAQCAGMARSAGVPDGSVTSLIARIGRDDHAGVAVPLQPGDPRTLSPWSLIEVWRAAGLDTLAGTREVTIVQTG